MRGPASGREIPIMFKAIDRLVSASLRGIHDGVLGPYGGAILGTLLIIVVIGHIGNILVPNHELEKPAIKLASATTSTPAPAPKKAVAAAPVQSLATLLASADAAAGKRTARKCSVCHDFSKGGPNKFGPNLWNVVGAKRARRKNYSYSKAMLAAGGTWTYKALNAFITNPRGDIKGTKMSFSGLKKAKQRANVIAFLRSLSDAPKPLP